MNIWTTIKTWLLSWFVSDKDLKIIDILEDINDLVKWALTIVEKIDNELKPELKRVASEGDKIDVYETVLKFLEQFKELSINAVEIANKVFEKPLPELLFTIAIELLKAYSGTNASLSTLRLAVELAYNIYKKTRN